MYTATCTKKHDLAPFVTYIVYVSQSFEYMICKEGFKEQFVQLRIFILGLFVELAPLSVLFSHFMVFLNALFLTWMLTLAVHSGGITYFNNERGENVQVKFLLKVLIPLLILRG